MKRSGIITCAVLLILFAGCTKVDVREGPAPGVRVDDVRASQAGIKYNSVAIVDKSLQQWYGKDKEKKSKIAIESTDSRRTPTGTLEAWAVIRNRTDFPLQIEGRVQFFDESKAPVEGPTAWQRVFLPPQSVATYKESSTNVYDIGYYYIEIREGR